MCDASWAYSDGKKDLINEIEAQFENDKTGDIVIPKHKWESFKNDYI